MSMGQLARSGGEETCLEVGLEENNFSHDHDGLGVVPSILQ